MAAFRVNRCITLNHFLTWILFSAAFLVSQLIILDVHKAWEQQSVLHDVLIDEGVVEFGHLCEMD